MDIELKKVGQRNKTRIWGHVTKRSNFRFDFPLLVKFGLKFLNAWVLREYLTRVDAFLTNINRRSSLRSPAMTED